MKEWGDKEAIGETILEELALYEAIFSSPHKKELASKSFVAGALSAILIAIKAMAGQDANDPGPKKLLEIYNQLDSWHKSHPT